MEIQQAGQPSAKVTADFSAHLLTKLLVGQKVEAIVITSALAAEVATIKIANTILQIPTPIPLQQGQVIQLELVKTGDGFVIKLTSLDKVVDIRLPAIRIDTLLKSGQLLAVEVVRKPVDNQLLVSIRNATGITQQQLPQHIDINVSRLNKQFQSGDRLLVEVVKPAPLTVNIRPDNLSRPQLLLEKIRQVIPQQLAKPELSAVVKAQRIESLPLPIKQEIQRLFQFSLDKLHITKPNVFKRALFHAGPFLERQLLNRQMPSVNQDFKANLLRLISVLETALGVKQQDGGVLGNATKPNASQLSSFLRTGLAKNSAFLPQLANTLFNSNNVQSPKVQQGTVLRESEKLNTSQLASFLRVGLAKDSAFLPRLASALLASPESTHTSPERILQSSDLQAQAVATLLAQLRSKFNMKAENASQSRLENSILRGLLKEVESVHAKLQLNQISMVKDPDSPSSPAAWLFDLPVKDKYGLEMMQLLIEQHERRNQSEDETDMWQVQLTLETQNLGPIKATVHMHDNDVKIILCAERKQSASLLEEHLELLSNALNRLGVNINHISCHCGEVAPVTSVRNYATQSSALVDISV